MDRQLGAGIIGCGNISTTYLKLAPLFRHIEMRAVADIDMAVAQARGAEFGVPAQSVKDLLKNPAVDIVVNLTVPAVHYKVSKQILLAGKHVYSEKPLTLTTAEARDLERIAKKKKLQVAGAPDTFLGGSQQLARKAIDDGDIGKVISGTAHILSHGMEHWHPNPDFFFKPGGGPILDMGPYYIASLINLVGPVKRVAALQVTARKERVISSAPRKGEKIKVTTPTTYHALLHFANGAAITLSASWDIYAHRHPNLEIYGTNGAIFLPDPNFFGGDVQLAGTDATPKTLTMWDHPFATPNWDGETRLQWANYRAAGLADMAEGIIKRRDIRCSISRMAHVVEVMTAIMAAGKSGKYVEIKSTCTRPKPLGPAEARALLR
ncbi:MAG: Gfo/Idh/MocA family oxidoreductase [Proteobacteria bacterium]|nr:Gfo/Idh/MocA family oxidoreductase [Pseudomonadota bacterium]